MGMNVQLDIMSILNIESILLLAVSVSSGHTVEAAMDAVNYYGGKIAGIGAIFSSVEKCRDIPVCSAFIRRRGGAGRSETVAAVFRPRKRGVDGRDGENDRSEKIAGHNDQRVGRGVELCVYGVLR